MKTPRLIERRQYMQTLRDQRGQNIIKVITGVRRCGKSTLLQMFADELLKNGVAQRQIQFYNFEDFDTLALGDAFQIHTHIKNKLVAKKMNYVFLDEVQNIKDFQRLVDSLFIKKNCDVYITGSNASLLSGELATLLTGRYIPTEVLPFSYLEYVEYLAKNNKKTRRKRGGFAVDTKEEFLKLSKKESFRNFGITDSIPFEMAMHRPFVDFLYDGGLPYAVQLGDEKQRQSQDFLRSVLETILEKDIFQRNAVYIKPAFNKLVDFLMDSIGSLVSPNSIANVFKSEKIPIDNKTVSLFLEYLADSYLFYKVPRYDVKGKNLLRTFDKYYLADTGFRKARLSKGKIADMGHLLENAVYLELRRRYDKVYVGKWNGCEVDFVAINTDSHPTYFQVALNASDPKTRERELRPLEAIRDSNPKFLLSFDVDVDPIYNGIKKLNVAGWMLAKD